MTAPVSGPLTLDRIACGRAARVSSVDWAQLVPSEAQRLREFGLDCGAEIVALHRGTVFSRDPLAVQIGAMRLVLRAAHARAFVLEPLDSGPGN